MSRKINIQLPMRINHYVLTEAIGEGGFGGVYKATSSRYDTEFAIKVQKEKTLDNELQLLLKLSHPNIVKIYDTFVHDNAQFVVMELCEGTLEDEVRRGNMPRCRKYQLAEQLISAVQFCHAHSIAHRDIKPSNMLIDKKGNLKLTDFGISRITHEGYTNRQDFRCTQLWAAPEVIAKNLHYNLFCADVWAVGLVLHYLFSGGKLPFPKEATADYLQLLRVSGQLPIERSIPMNLKSVIYKALMPTPRERITMEAMRKINLTEGHHLYASVIFQPRQERFKCTCTSCPKNTCGTITNSTSFQNFRLHSNLVGASWVVLSKRT